MPVAKRNEAEALEVSPEERETFYEKRYSEPGFGIWMGNFRDIFVDQKANDPMMSANLRS